MKVSKFAGAPGAIAILVILSALCGNSAAAATSAPGACQSLASIVEHSVARALRMERGNVYSYDSFASPALQGCATAAATVSHAFFTTLRDLGTELAWSHGRTIDPGNYCPSHYLDQCFPRRRGTGYGFSSVSDMAIAAAWATVVANMHQVMPFGIRSDIAYFEPERLTTNLVLSLDATLRASGLPLRRDQ